MLLMMDLTRFDEIWNCYFRKSKWKGSIIVRLIGNIFLGSRAWFKTPTNWLSVIIDHWNTTKANMHSWLWHGAALTYTDLTILQWWGKNALFYPRWSILAKKYLAIPALYMYVPSERVFSLAGHLVNKKRARLSPSNIGNIISWIKTWNNTDNYTIWVWMTMFCFLPSLQYC
jgi:hypothetical protein